VSLRDGPFQDLRVPLTWTAAVAVIVAAIIGVALLLNDRRETVQLQAYGATKSAIDTVSEPVGAVVAAPGRWTGAALSDLREYFFVVSENRRLRHELADLQGMRDQNVALQNINARYQAILGLNIQPPLPMATAMIITDSRGPFANSRLADAGTDRGVAIGNPVMSEHGLVGRVVGVTRGASRILLLTDVASRTPVLIDRTNARAILTGDGGGTPKLAYMRGVNPAKVGDRVLTSGDGGVFPRGLPVGVAVQGLDGTWRVKLDADNAPIDYVRILLFRSFDQLIDQKALANSVMPPLSPTEAAAVAAEAASPASSAKPGSAKPGPAGPGPASAVSAKPAASAKPAPAKKPAAKRFSLFGHVLHAAPAPTPRPVATNGGGQ
jgi:rod shape-determining protein MreC